MSQGRQMNTPIGEAASSQLASALVAALAREQSARDDESAKQAQLPKNRRVWMPPEGLVEPDAPSEHPRIEPAWKTWVLDEDDRNVEVDGQDELQRQIDKTTQILSPEFARSVIEASNAAGFDLYLTQPSYRICDHTQLEEVIRTSEYWNRSIPRGDTLAKWLRRWLGLYWGLDSAVISTFYGGEELGVLVNEAWASADYPERVVFWRVQLGIGYPVHIFDPNCPGYPTMQGRRPKHHHCPPRWRDEEGMILL